MGNNLDKQDSDIYNQQFQAIMEHFELDDTHQDSPHYGIHDLYHLNENPAYNIVTKDLNVNTLEDFTFHAEHWEMRVNLYTNPSIFKQHNDGLCGQSFKIKLIIDCIQGTLEDDMRNRHEFKEDEIWNLIDSIVTGISFLQTNSKRHGFLKLSTIYSVTAYNNTKSYKIADEQLMSYPGLFFDLSMKDCSNKDNVRNIYPSPLVMKALGLKERQALHNNFKSDVFTLGMIILHVGLWGPSDDCYDWINFRINDYVIQDKMAKLRVRFAKDLCQLVQEMLTMDENFRPDFNTLDQKLNNIFAVKNNRIVNKTGSVNLAQQFQLRNGNNQVPNYYQQNNQLQQQNVLPNNINEQLNNSYYNQHPTPSQNQSFNHPLTSNMNQPNYYSTPLNQNRSNNIFGQNQQQNGIFQSNSQNNLHNYQSNYQQNYNSNNQFPSNNNYGQNNYLQPPEQNKYQQYSPQPNQQQYNSHSPYGQQPNYAPPSSQPNYYPYPPIPPMMFFMINPAQPSYQPQYQTPPPQNRRSLRRSRQYEKINYTDGSSYEGEAVQGIREGWGKLKFQDGAMYEGNWSENQMSGKGTLYYSNGEIAYEGDWCNDKFNNFGHLHNQKLKKLQEAFDYKDMNKIGNYWLKYEGDFKMDKKDGFGMLYFTNGEKYAGNFIDDFVSGYGTFYKMDGSSVSGYWDDNILIKEVE